MLKKTKLCTGLMVACGGVLLSAGQSAMAQATQSLERVEITGSNIKRTDTETASPVQVISKQELDQAGKDLPPALLEARRAKYLAMSEGRGPRAGDGGAPGRVFVLDGEGRPQGLALRVGATDGSYTEVLAGDVKEGTGVIIGGGPRVQGGPQETSPMQRPRGPRLF